MSFDILYHFSLLGFVIIFGKVRKLPKTTLLYNYIALRSLCILCKSCSDCRFEQMIHNVHIFRPKNKICNIFGCNANVTDTDPTGSGNGSMPVLLYVCTQ